MPGNRGNWSHGKRKGPAGLEANPTLKSYLPQELYPPTSTPVTPAPTTTERAHLANFRLLRERLREGPLYTVLDPNTRVHKNQRQKAIVNPFENMPTYSQRYKKPRRKMPQLNTREYGKSALLIGFSNS
jgi:DNA-directed RNA polymerase III subunit RPC7